MVLHNLKKLLIVKFLVGLMILLFHQVLIMILLVYLLLIPLKVVLLVLLLVRLVALVAYMLVLLLSVSLWRSNMSRSFRLRQIIAISLICVRFSVLQFLITA